MFFRFVKNPKFQVNSEKFGLKALFRTLVNKEVAYTMDKSANSVNITLQEIEKQKNPHKQKLT